MMSRGRLFIGFSYSLRFERYLSESRPKGFGSL
jgi:hypothetical protein